VILETKAIPVIRVLLVKQAQRVRLVILAQLETLAKRAIPVIRVTLETRVTLAIQAQPGILEPQAQQAQQEIREPQEPLAQLARITF
jgi:hypothetical protein